MTGGGGGGGGTVGESRVYHNRDLLKEYHARGGTCPWCPPGSATYVVVLLSNYNFYCAFLVVLPSNYNLYLTFFVVLFAIAD